MSVVFGYDSTDWRQLVAGLRRYHLTLDADVGWDSPDGTRYEIRAGIGTPAGQPFTLHKVWQIDKGVTLPRLNYTLTLTEEAYR